MTAFVCFDTTGNLRQWGDCDEALLALHALPGTTAIFGKGKADTHYVTEGVLRAYTPYEVAKKANKPPYLSFWDNGDMEWKDLRTLDHLKTDTWYAIKQARAQAEYAGFTWDGSTFDSDATSQNRITGAVTLAQMSTAFSIDWVLADNSVRTLNQVDMLQVGAALGNHVVEQFSKGIAYRTAVEEATTAEEVQAVVWE